MKNNVLTIARKELARFFSNRVSAAVAIVLPGLMLFVMWTFMGNAFDSMTSTDEDEQLTLAATSLPESIEALAKDAGITVLPMDERLDTSTIQSDIQEATYDAFVVFPANFDDEVAVYDPQSGQIAPQIQVYYDSTVAKSSSAYSIVTLLLDGYESSLANRFDVNASEDAFDVSDEQSRTSQVVVLIMPMILLLFLFSGCMSIAAESIAGEKERGTMTTLLATPIKRRDIALGKILALTLIGFLVAASSTIALFASLPNLAGGSFDINVYGPTEYALLALVVLSTTLLIIMLITLVSALAKTTKEAQVYLTPLMVIVIAVGLLGLLGDGSQTEGVYYLIPLYNSVQCMIGVLTFDFQPINFTIAIVSNLVYTGMGVFVLQRMFHSERLMFAR
jgi:sodium transport system permease protein